MEQYLKFTYEDGSAEIILDAFFPAPLRLLDRLLKLSEEDPDPEGIRRQMQDFCREKREALQKKLPEGVTIRGCLTCRYGNLCPCGNEPGKVYCLKGESVTCKMDVVRFFDGDVWVQRKKAYFDFCEDWKAVSADHDTYSDFEDES